MHFAEATPEVRAQLQLGGEPVDSGYFARWLKAKGSVEEAEHSIRLHAAWRAQEVPNGRILEVPDLVPMPAILMRAIHLQPGLAMLGYYVQLELDRPWAVAGEYSDLRSSQADCQPAVRCSASYRLARVKQQV